MDAVHTNVRIRFVKKKPFRRLNKSYTVFGRVFGFAICVNVQDIAAGFYHSVAIAEGCVFQWGFNIGSPPSDL